MTELAYERLDLLCDLERWSEAATLAGTMVGSDPGNDTAWCVLARCRLALGDPDAALDAARKAASLTPDSEWPHRLISFATSQLGRHDDAVTAAREAVRLEPGLWQTHARLAGAAGQHPRGKEEAARAAARAVSLAPDEPQAQLIYGSVAAAQGRREEADQAFHRVLALDPQNSTAHHLLAWSRLGRLTSPVALARAVTGFARALSADPTAEASRHSLELTARTVLARTAYYLFIACYLGMLLADHLSVLARTVPVVLVAAPVLFAGEFVRRLDRQLRAFLARLLRRRLVGLTVGLELGCVVLVLIGALTPEPVRVGTAIAAPLIALGARLALYLDGRPAS